jgi:uncharacterized protein (DUF302 family)
MRSLILFVLGVLVGAGALAAVVYTQAADVMIAERESPVGLDETVNRITAAAKAEGWVVQGVKKLEESIKKNGGGDVRPVRLVNICHAKHAAKMMNDDGARRVSVFMPCTISVYEKSDGKIYVGSVNASLLGRLFGGVVSEVMGDTVSASQEKFLAAIDRPLP